MKKAPVYLWTGLGWGKSTSAFGVALRAVGHGKRVIIIQFMKGWDGKLGEVKAQKLLGKNYEVHQFGRKGWVDLDNPSEKDKILAMEALEFAKEVVKKKPFLLVLDEINLAVASKLVDEEEVLNFLDSVPERTHVYLTGRHATPKLIARADYAEEINTLKGRKKLAGEKGIDF